MVKSKYKSAMNDARAVIVGIENDGKSTWRIKLKLSVPAGTTELNPDFLYKLGRHPQTAGILVLNAPEPMLVTVRGKPWVNVGDSIPVAPAATHRAMRKARPAQQVRVKQTRPWPRTARFIARRLFAKP